MTLYHCGTSPDGHAIRLLCQIADIKIHLERVFDYVTQTPSFSGNIGGQTQYPKIESPGNHNYNVAMFCVRYIHARKVTAIVWRKGIPNHVYSYHSLEHVWTQVHSLCGFLIQFVLFAFSPRFENLFS